MVSDTKGRDCSKFLKRRGPLGRSGWTNRKSKSACSMPVKCRKLILNHQNFKISAAPDRIMFFDHGSWMDFPPEAATTLCGGFVDGRPMVEVRIDGSLYLVDFLRMLQVDLGSGCERSIAWIDVNGKCFFPKYFVGEHGDECERDRSCLKLEVEIKIDPSEGSMVGNGHDGSGVDRISVSSKTKGQNCRLVADEGVCDGRVHETGNGEKFDSLEKEPRIGGATEKGSDEERDIKVVGLEPVVHNRGDADSPMEIVPIDSVARVKDQVGVLAVTPLKRVGEKCSLAARDTALDLPGEVAKSFNHKRVLIDSNLDCSESAAKEEEQAGDAYFGKRKKDCLANTTSCFDAPVGTSKLMSTGFSDQGYKPSKEENTSLFGVSGPTGEVKGIHATTKEVAIVDTDVNNDCSYPPNGKANVRSGTELLPIAVQSPSAKEPVVNHLNDDTTAADCPVVTSTPTCLPSRLDKLVPHVAKLNDDGRAYAKIKNEFLKGLGSVGSLVNISAIYWCSRTSASSLTRFHSFQRHLDVMKRTRGDGNANVKYAWHGASAESVERILLHGFGEPKANCGSESYGSGIYLSPQEKSHLSVLHADPDDNDQQHVLLCHVILGKMEQVLPGSSQFHPSNENFDSGVDDLSNPRHYIIWSTHMNAHILPEYVLTFRFPEHVKGTWVERSFIPPVNTTASTDVAHSAPSSVQANSANPVHKSKDACNGVVCSSGSSKMSFPKLFLFLETRLPRVVVQKLENLYDEYKAGKIAKEILLRSVRVTVGDNLLIEAINGIRNQV